MPLFEEKSVKIDGGTVVWDGIKSPEQITPTSGSPFTKYTLKIVVPPNSPDLAILDQLGRTCLQESVFKGQLPAGGHWIMKQAGAHEFNGLFPGWWVVNGITYQPPQVFDEQGNILNAMQYGPALFPGQQVNMLVSAKDYNEKSKGIKAQLEGFQIVASANAQPISVGGGSVNAAGAFGGGGAPQNPPAQGYGAPQGGAPQHQPSPQGGAPSGYGQPAQNAPAPNAAPPQQNFGGPAGGAPAHQGYGAGAPNVATQQGGASATTFPSNQAPNQAHNFLPGQ